MLGESEKMKGLYSISSDTPPTALSSNHKSKLCSLSVNQIIELNQFHFNNPNIHPYNSCMILIPKHYVKTLVNMCKHNTHIICVTNVITTTVKYTNQITKSNTQYIVYIVSFNFNLLLNSIYRKKILKVGIGELLVKTEGKPEVLPSIKTELLPSVKPESLASVKAESLVLIKIESLVSGKTEVLVGTESNRKTYTYI